MKKFALIVLGLAALATVQAQEVAPAEPGAVYGKLSESGTVVKATELEAKIGGAKYEGKVEGKVVEVCQAMGCWAKIQKGDGSTIMIKVKDHEFAMPKDIVGKTVVAEGTAEVKETSVKMLKHYAEDAGKSKEEIALIKEPKKEVLMTIKGVKVIQ
jgi:Domain of unknown function (DUF4920)